MAACLYLPGRMEEEKKRSRCLTVCVLVVPRLTFDLWSKRLRTTSHPVVYYLGYLMKLSIQHLHPITVNLMKTCLRDVTVTSQVLYRRCYSDTALDLKSPLMNTFPNFHVMVTSSGSVLSKQRILHFAFLFRAFHQPQRSHYSSHRPRTLAPLLVSVCACLFAVCATTWFL